jgi:multidrug efflux pump subunit AcrA (membrane-fusion protein)
VQAEKEALAAEKEALRKEKETLEQSRRASGEYRDQGGFTAEDYEAAAVAYREEGNDEMAQVAQQRAQQTRQAAQQAQVEATRSAFFDQIQRESAIRPELKDPTTPLGQLITETLKENQHLYTRPDGFKRAVAIAEAHIKAGSVPALQEENTRLKQEIEKLTKKLSIGPSGPTKRGSSTVDPANMSEAEMERLVAGFGSMPLGG